MFRNRSQPCMAKGFYQDEEMWLKNVNIFVILLKRCASNIHLCYGKATKQHHNSFQQFFVGLSGKIKHTHTDTQIKKKTLQPAKHYSRSRKKPVTHCMALLTTLRTGIHFSKARLLLAHGDAFSKKTTTWCCCTFLKVRHNVLPKPTYARRQ